MPSYCPYTFYGIGQVKELCIFLFFFFFLISREVSGYIHIHKILSDTTLIMLERAMYHVCY